MPDASASPPVDEAQLSELLERVRTRTRIPGVAAAVATGGHLITTAVGTYSSRSADPLKPTSGFALGCVTKLLVAVLCLELARNGRLDISAPLDEYLPELRDTPRGNSQVLRDLLMHTSGYQQVSLLSVIQQRWDEVAAARRLFQPGMVFSYEHTGFGILGAILQRVTALGIDTLLTTQVLGPLGLLPTKRVDSSASIVGHEYDAESCEFKPVVAGSYRSNGAIADLTLSIGDLALLAVMFARGGSTNGAELGLSTETVSRLRTEQTRLPGLVEGTRNTGLPTCFGLGCGMYAPEVFGVDGGFTGQVCCIRFDPVRRLGIAVGLNAASAKVRNSIADAIMSACGSVSSQAVNVRRDYDFSLDAMAGRYVGADGSELTVSVADAGLDLDFALAEQQSRLQISAQVDRGANRVTVRGVAGQCGLSFFQEPVEKAACVALGLTTFRQEERG